MSELSPPPAAPAPRQASTFARVGLLVYTLLIVYASCYPFANWRNSGIALTGFLHTRLPHYWTGFDAVTNVIAYVPLGILLVFALYPHVRRGWAVLLAILGGVLLSGSMEAVQTFLPSRVSSNLDFMTNTGGSVIGALLGVLLTHTFLERSRFLQVRREWFTTDAGRGLVVLGLWPLAQIYPQGYLFGHGQIAPILSDWLSSLLGAPVDLSALLRRGAELGAEQYWLAETVITACGLTGALLTLLCIMRRTAPGVQLVLLLLGAALAIKSLSSALMFDPANAFAWFTPGALGGLLFSCTMLFGLAFAPPQAQRRVAVLMLLISLFVVNLISVNPYFSATLQTLVQGKFLNFYGAARFLALLWPFFALWFLLHRTHTLKKA